VREMAFWRQKKSESCIEYMLCMPHVEYGHRSRLFLYEYINRMILWKW